MTAPIHDGAGTSTPRHGPRTIAHVDMDAFYVSVELLRRRELVGKPVVVGATGGRGVVAAASYEARRYGVRSAMSGLEARRRCPDAIFLEPDHVEYSRVSRLVHDVFNSITPLVEPLALDEAFLDVTGARGLFGDGEQIGRTVRSAVAEATGLTCSVGVATNKFVAKLASVEAKPVATPAGINPGRAVVVIPSGDEASFVQSLPIERLWGVGPSTRRRLADAGVHTITGLLTTSTPVLTAAVGSAAAEHLVALAHGIDERPVVPDREAKSIGHEETFGVDISDSVQLRSHLVRMADLVAGRVRRRGHGARTWTVKVRRGDFSTATRATSTPQPIDDHWVVLDALAAGMEQARGGHGVRLLGVSASNFDDLGPGSDGQLGLFDDPPSKELSSTSATAAIDAVRDRFGEGAIRPASAIDTQRRTPRSR
jgi:DNA polymerase-4